MRSPRRPVHLLCPPLLLTALLLFASIYLLERLITLWRRFEPGWSGAA